MLKKITTGLAKLAAFREIYKSFLGEGYTYDMDKVIFSKQWSVRYYALAAQLFKTQ
jgi:hypothetical protein